MKRSVFGFWLIFVLTLSYCVNPLAQDKYVPLQPAGSKFGNELNWIQKSQLLPQRTKTSLPTDFSNSQRGQEFGKAPTGSGAIRGRVTNASGGAPISNVVITSRQLACPYHSFQDTTGSDGYYLISGLSCGQYSVRTTNDSVFVDVYWNDQPIWGTPDTVLVASSDTTENVNFSLRVGGRITGTITLPGSLLVLLTFVFAIDTTSGIMYYDMPTGFLGTASYSIEGLPTGIYKLRSFNLLGYIDVYYNNKSSWVTADLVSVTEGSTTSSKNFTLSSGGKIQGNVSSAAKVPLDSALVLGVLLQDTLEWFQIAFTNSSGNYSLAGLRSGYWKIFTLGDTTYASEFYNNKGTWSSADSILVTAPSTVTGKDFSLEVGGSISGHVYDQEGNPISNCTVAASESSLIQLLNQGGIPLIAQAGISLRGDITSADGSYKITGLRTGDYYVKASTECDNQWYDHKDSLEEADLVHVTMPSDAPDINFNLPSLFIQGDVNGDGVVDLGDVVYLITYLYKSGPAPDPLEAGDANCSGLVELGDIVYLISYLYKSGPPPCC
jgi:hypothetical protein